MKDEKKTQDSQNSTQKPPGLGPFDRLMRGLMRVPKAEVDEAEAGRKLAAKKKRAARRKK